jgi:S-formylglutathione hydrolase FrmB
VKSPAVGAVEPVRFIVPKGWKARTRSTYPVLYALHGGNDTYVSWTRSTDIKKTARAWNALVVMPDGGEHGSYTDWFNYGRRGRPAWEDFHTRELIQLVERDFHGSTVRAAMGLSSGAQGAVTYAARHPGLYRYVASYSGILHMTMPGIPAIMMATGLLSKGSDPFAVWGIPGTKAGASNWAAHDPYNFAANLRGTGLFVSSGTTGLPGPLDPPWGTVSPGDYVNDVVVGGSAELITGMTSEAMVKKLRALKIPVTTDFYGNAWHQWAYWNREYKKAWPLLMKAIGAHRV